MRQSRTHKEFHGKTNLFRRVRLAVPRHGRPARWFGLTRWVRDRLLIARSQVVRLMATAAPGTPTGVGGAGPAKVALAVVVLSCLALATLAAVSPAPAEGDRREAVVLDADRELADRASRSGPRAAPAPGVPGVPIEDLTAPERAALQKAAADAVAADRAAADRAAADKAAAAKATADKTVAEKATAEKAAADKAAAEKAAAAKAAARPQPVAGLTQTQMNNAARIVAAGQELGLPKRAYVLAVACAMQESTLRNLASNVIAESFRYPHEGSGSDHDSVGLFQQRPSSGWGSVRNLMKPEYSATKFYEALARVPGWQDKALTYAIQAVQVSAYPQAYAKHEPMAAAVVEALT